MTAQTERNRFPRCRPGLLLTALLVAFPALLFLPAFYYSLTTPFGLVDDYSIWKFIRIFDSWSQFGQWFASRLLSLDYSERPFNTRYVPFWDLYQAAVWKAFGPRPWLHHLARWGVYFSAVFMFLAAFRCFQRQPTKPGRRSRFIYILPPTLLAYLWLFFPNLPAAQLSPKETDTVFFLGLCSWMLARRLAEPGRTEGRRAKLLSYGLFLLGCGGLAWSKEPNLAPLLWLLLTYYALLPWAAAGGAARRRRPVPEKDGTLIRRQVQAEPSDAPTLRPPKKAMIWPLLGGAPLLLLFAHSLANGYVIYGLGGYGIPNLTPELIRHNALWLAGELFQGATAPLITTGLVSLTVMLLLFMVSKARRREAWLPLLDAYSSGRRFKERGQPAQESPATSSGAAGEKGSPGDGEFIFVLFLLGLFVSIYLILLASWAPVSNYWYPLIPLFATLLAFAAKFALEAAARRPPLPWRQRSLPAPTATALLLAAFILLFIAANYYNFLYQTAIHHRTRHNDARVLAEITRRHDQGQYIRLDAVDGDRAFNLNKYFHEFLPRFYGRHYRINSAPPEDPGQTWHAVTHSIEQWRPALAAKYPPLATARRLADRFQLGPPPRSEPWGEVLNWEIYASDLSRFWNNGRRLTQPLQPAGKPLIRSVYTVYHRDGYLIYLKEPCGPEEADRQFFAHLTPVDAAQVTEWRAGHGFNNLDHIIANRRFRAGKKCLALLPLEDYAIRQIRTGQFIPGQGEIWAAEVSLTD